MSGVFVFKVAAAIPLDTAFDDCLPSVVGCFLDVEFDVVTVDFVNDFAFGIVFSLNIHAMCHLDS